MADTSNPCGCTGWRDSKEPGIYVRTLCANHATIEGQPYCKPTLSCQFDCSDWYDQYVAAVGGVTTFRLGDA